MEVFDQIHASMVILNGAIITKTYESPIVFVAEKLIDKAMGFLIRLIE